MKTVHQNFVDTSLKILVKENCEITIYILLSDLVVKKPVESLKEVTDALNDLGPAVRLYKEVKKLIFLLLVIPATSATAERSFSAVDNGTGTFKQRYDIKYPQG